MKALLRLFFALIWSGYSAGVLAEEKLTIAAASDLRFALEEILQVFQAQYAQEFPQLSLQVIYGSSGKISNQIRQGAPFDVFFSADQRYTTELYQAKVTADPGTLYARGRLVLWSSRYDMRGVDLKELTQDKYRKIAIAQPSHAPYGERARQSLVAAGVWSQVESKLVFGENIAQTAQLAQSGAADVAIVALSLVKNPHLGASQGAALAPHYQLIDAASHQPLLQSYALTKQGAQKPQARQLTTFMQSAAARRILTRYGFELPQTATGTPR